MDKAQREADLVGVSKKMQSVIPFLGVNRQDIDINAMKTTKAEKT